VKNNPQTLGGDELPPPKKANTPSEGINQRNHQHQQRTKNCLTQTIATRRRPTRRHDHSKRRTLHRLRALLLKLPKRRHHARKSQKHHTSKNTSRTRRKNQNKQNPLISQNNHPLFSGQPSSTISPYVVKNTHVLYR